MSAQEKDGLDAFLFEDKAELLDIKCFRGDRADVSEDDIKQEIHSAFVQKKMKRATVSAMVPAIDAVRQNVNDLVKALKEPT